MRKTLFIAFLFCCQNIGVIAMDKPSEWYALSEGVSILITSNTGKYRLCDGFGGGKSRRLAQIETNGKWEDIKLSFAQQEKLGKLMLALKKKAYRVDYTNSVYTSDGELVEVNIAAGMFKLSVIDDMQKIACHVEIKSILSLICGASKKR